MAINQYRTHVTHDFLKIAIRDTMTNIFSENRNCCVTCVMCADKSIEKKLRTAVLDQQPVGLT